jgi:hypothetical protein
MPLKPLASIIVIAFGRARASHEAIQRNSKDQLSQRNAGLQGMADAIDVALLKERPRLPPCIAARLPPQSPIRSERKQRGLRNPLGKCRLLHREVRSVKLLMCLPIFAGVFFRPEEYRLVSIVVNDVCTVECVPLDIRLEQ